MCRIFVTGLKVLHSCLAQDISNFLPLHKCPLSYLPSSNLSLLMDISLKMTPQDVLLKVFHLLLHPNVFRKMTSLKRVVQ